MDRTWALALAVAAAATVWLLPSVPTHSAVGFGLVAAAATKAGVWLVRHERAVRQIRTRAT
jgi:hypothetical protein